MVKLYIQQLTILSCTVIHVISATFSTEHFGTGVSGKGGKERHSLGCTI